MSDEQAPKAPALDIIAPVSPFSEANRVALQDAYDAARGNQATTYLDDDCGRTWLICPDVVDNKSVILLRATKGQAIEVRNISTAVLDPDAANQAIVSIDEAMTETAP